MILSVTQTLTQKLSYIPNTHASVPLLVPIAPIFDIGHQSFDPEICDDHESNGTAPTQAGSDFDNFESQSESDIFRDGDSDDQEIQ